MSKVADKIIEEPRKVWVKLKSSGDLVEINLDRDKPERWEKLDFNEVYKFTFTDGRVTRRRSSGN